MANVFDIQRKKAQQQATAAEQQQTEALQRRFAQMGALRSGAAIKQEQMAKQETQEQLGNQMESIGAAEGEFERQKEEVAEGRRFTAQENALGRAFQAQQAKEQMQFQAGENVMGRQFSSAEAEKGRQFQSVHDREMFNINKEFQQLEAEKQRAFAAGENALGRKFEQEQLGLQQKFAESENAKARELQASEGLAARTMQKDLAAADLEFKKSIQAWNETQAGKEYLLAEQQFALDKEAQLYNTRLSTAMAKGEGYDMQYLETGKWTQTQTPIVKTSPGTPNKGQSSTNKFSSGKARVDER